MIDGEKLLQSNFLFMMSLGLPMTRFKGYRTIYLTAFCSTDIAIEGFCNEAKWQTVLFVIEGRRPEITNNSLIAEGEARAINAKVCQFAKLQN